VIIRCFNEEAHIGRLLTGVSLQTIDPDEIIVVDSGSTDATVSIAQAFGARVVSISPERFSFGSALNVGLRCAEEADFAVFASAHVYPVYDTWLERLLVPLQDATIALSYGRQLTPPDGRFSEQRLLAQWFPARSQFRQPHPFCNNANAAIRTDAWKELPYDEELTGLEDLDWAKRATDAGWNLAYVAEAPVVHVHDERFAQVVNRYRREAIAHKQIYGEQQIGALAAICLAGANILGDFREALASGVLGHHLGDIVRFRVAQFLGTYQGFTQSGPVTEVLRRRFYYPTSSVGTTQQLDAAPPGQAIDYDAPERV
jgi:glycosyltransferase involved in cell wall biosynthesis